MANQLLVKRINRARVMNAIRLRSPVPRSEIAQLLGLDRKSVTNLVRKLIDEGVVVEVGKRTANTGRPLTLLEFDRNTNLAIGISLSEAKIVGRLVDLYGDTHASTEKRFPFGSSLSRILNAIEAVYRDLKRAASGRIVTTGLSVPGIINVSSGLVHESVNIRAIQGKNIKDCVGAFVEEPLVLEQGALSKACAEKWFGIGCDEPTFVCVDLGIGIAAAFVQDRRLHTYAARPASEIGHSIVERGGRLCRCGHRGCLEAYLSDRIILREINEGSGADFQELQEIEEVDKTVRRVLQKAGRRLGFVLSYLVNMACPPLLIINGPLVCEKFREVVMPEILCGAAEGSLPELLRRTRIVPSDLKQAAALGAAASGLSELFEVDGHSYV